MFHTLLFREKSLRYRGLASLKTGPKDYEIHKIKNNFDISIEILPNVYLNSCKLNLTLISSVLNMLCDHAVSYFGWCPQDV